MPRTGTKAKRDDGGSLHTAQDERDRRRWPRRDVERPCKVYHSPTARFLSARTTNVSAGGALVRIEPHRSLRAGDSVQVAVAWGDAVVLPAGSMVPARVVRISGDAEAELLALEYARPDGGFGAG